MRRLLLTLVDSNVFLTAKAISKKNAWAALDVYAKALKYFLNMS